MCSAGGPNPTAICQIKPKSASRVRPGALVIQPDEDLIHNPPAICRQGDVSTPVTAGAKLLQDLRYQSPEWQSVYGHLRASIEGMHGNVKSGSHESLGDARRRRLRSRAAQSILTAFLLFSLNVRLIKAIQAKAQLNDDGELQKRSGRRLPPVSFLDFVPVQKFRPPRTDPPPLSRPAASFGDATWRSTGPKRALATAVGHSRPSSATRTTPSIAVPRWLAAVSCRGGACRGDSLN